MRKVRARSLMLAGMLATSWLQAANAAEFVLVNASGATLHQLYISPCGSGHWGSNQLAWTPIWSSRSFTISDIAPGCYDLMVILPGFNECIIAGAALRSILTWTITSWTLTQAGVGDCSHISYVASAGRKPWQP